MSVGMLTRDGLRAFSRGREGCVSVTIIDSKGSTPRKIGAAMLVGDDSQRDTIGGGQLEFEAVEIARALLGEPGAAWVRLQRHFPLGPTLGQCCGGHVSLLFEVWRAAEIDWLGAHGGEEESLGLMARRLESGEAPVVIADRHDAPDLPLALVREARAMLAGTARVEARNFSEYFLSPLNRQQIALYLYGAGHVGRALVHVLKDTDFHINWVDLEGDRFPDDVPDYVTKVPARSPALIATHAHERGWHLVMTRSHQLDLEICHALLRRDNFDYLGMIGSATKAVRFDRRLAELGIGAQARGRMICPVGLAGATSNAPSAIALSVAADFMLRLESLGARKMLEGVENHE